MEPIAEEVRAFLARSIESIDQLEMLRLLGEDQGREWAAADLAREVQAKPAAVAAHAAALHSRGLITAEVRDGGTFCRYGPHNPEAERLVELVLQAYRERPVSMIKLVYARPADPLKAFADAFRLRKEGE